jgi:hypothetical protein
MEAIFLLRLLAVLEKTDILPGKARRQDVRKSLILFLFFPGPSERRRCRNAFIQRQLHQSSSLD